MDELLSRMVAKITDRTSTAAKEFKRKLDHFISNDINLKKLSNEQEQDYIPPESKEEALRKLERLKEEIGKTDKKTLKIKIQTVTEYVENKDAAAEEEARIKESVRSMKKKVPESISADDRVKFKISKVMEDIKDQSVVDSIASGEPERSDDQMEKTRNYLWFFSQ